MKKICFITTVHGTLRTFVLKTAEFLHNNTDWDISFICNYDEQFANELPEYINYIPVNMVRGISFKGIKAMLEMVKIFKREKFDLVQFSTPNASLYAAIASKIAKIPVRLYCQWGMVFVGFEGFKRKIFKTIEKLVCRLATHIQPDSKSNLDFSIAEGLYPAEKGAVVWNGSACGINLSKFDVSKKDIYRAQMREKLNIKPDDFVFGFVGRITRDKGVNELLAAFKELYSAHPNAKLIMVGVPENVQTLNQDLYDWAQESSAVIFTGRSNVVEQHLSAMDTYILPSYREGFGMGVIEAEAMGVPVIVTNIPGPIDAMLENETGLVIPKKDTSALKNAMKELLTNPSTAIAYGNNGVTHAKNHFEQQQFFKQVLENRKTLLKQN